MSYNKLGFTSGQTLKAEHLNHMEDGIANAYAGGTSNTRLLGEVVLTSQNCTASEDFTILNFNSELVSQVTALLAECGSHVGAIVVEAFLMNMRLMATAQYVAQSSITGENIQFCLIDDTSSQSIAYYILRRSYYSTSQTAFVQAVVGGYPMTIKVYAA